MMHDNIVCPRVSLASAERRQPLAVGLPRLRPRPVVLDRRLPRHGRHAMARGSAILNLGMNSPNQCTVHDSERIIVRKYLSRDTY